MADFLAAVAKQSDDYKFGIKQGDIVVVVPSTHKFNEDELKQFIIVPLTGLTREEADKLTAPLWDNGKDIPTLDGKAEMVITGKRKHQIAISDMETILTSTGSTVDSGKLVDPKQEYQPFVTAKTSLAVKSVDVVTDKSTSTYRKDFS